MPTFLILFSDFKSEINDLKSPKSPTQSILLVGILFRNALIKSDFDSELKQFIHNYQPDIICLNEIKQTEYMGNYNFDIFNYNTIFKVRVDNIGGGVAIILKNNIKYEKIINFDHFYFVQISKQSVRQSYLRIFVD